jgi:hypothetical protein
MLTLGVATVAVILTITWGGSTYDWASAQIFGPRAITPSATLIQKA